MLPGIEAKHVWQPASGDPLTLGGVDQASVATWPRYRLLKIDGRQAKPDQDDRRDPASGKLGEIARRATLRGKTEAWEGLIIAQSLSQLRTAADDLIAAFAEGDEGTMTIQAPASYTGLDNHTFTARVMTCSSPDQQTFGPAIGVGQGYVAGSGGWVRPFTLGLRLSDPRYYEATERTAQTSTFLAAGGVELPLTAPFYMDGPTVPLGALVAHNGGRAPADPVFELHGPAVDPGIVNDTLDAALIFKTGSLTLASGQVMLIDFNSRSITIDGEDVSRDRIDWARSNWWDQGMPGLKVGDQTIRYVGGQVTDPAYLLARWHNPLYG